MKPDTRPSASRVAAHRARLRAAGLRPIEVWAAPEDHARIREFVSGLSRPLPVVPPAQVVVPKQPAADPERGATE
jgi:hypothetical protein